MRTDGVVFRSKWSSSCESSTRAGWALAPAGLWRWLRSVNHATDEMPEPARYVGDESGPSRGEQNGKRARFAVEMNKFELG